MADTSEPEVKPDDRTDKQRLTDIRAAINNMYRCHYEDIKKNIFQRTGMGVYADLRWLYEKVTKKEIKVEPQEEDELVEV